MIVREHEVIGTVHSLDSMERVRAFGAKPVVLDLLDAAAVHKALLGNKPDAIVHEATALANARLARNLDRSFAQTNRLRTEGMDNLPAAAREVIAVEATGRARMSASGAAGVARQARRLPRAQVQLR